MIEHEEIQNPEFPTWSAKDITKCLECGRDMDPNDCDGGYFNCPHCGHEQRI